MMRIKALLAVCLLFISTNIYACINEYRTLLTGEVTQKEPSSGKVTPKAIDKLKLREKAEHLLKQYEEFGALENLSDYAAALIYLGEYQEAKGIYLQIESESPQLYTTASNLGTVYELTGQPDSALLWIKKSIEINPYSHGGSEWIHLKILEFQMANSNNYSKSILGLDFGLEALPSNSMKYDLQQLEQYIRHQLRERSVFVKPKNRIVGNIYFDLGNTIAQSVDVQAALESYEMAKEYGFESDLLNQRIAAFENLAAKAERLQVLRDMVEYILDHFKVFFWSGLGGFILFIIPMGKWMKNRKKRRLAKSGNSNS